MAEVAGLAPHHPHRGAALAPGLRALDPPVVERERRSRAGPRRTARPGRRRAPARGDHRAAASSGSTRLTRPLVAAPATGLAAVARRAWHERRGRAAGAPPRRPARPSARPGSRMRSWPLAPGREQPRVARAPRRAARAARARAGGGAPPRPRPRRRRWRAPTAPLGCSFTPRLDLAAASGAGRRGSARAAPGGAPRRRGCAARCARRTPRRRPPGPRSARSAGPTRRRRREDAARGRARPAAAPGRVSVVARPRSGPPAGSSSTAARTSADISTSRPAGLAEALAASRRRGPSAAWTRPAMTVRIAGVPLSRISWIVTVGICLIAALLLLLNGYSGLLRGAAGGGRRGGGEPALSS